MVATKICTDTIKLNTGAEMPMIGFGTAIPGGHNVYEAIKIAIENGYRCIDTAAIYGNEEIVGKAIRDSGLPREDFFVITKLWCSQAKNPELALSSSLKRLGLDYVDLYLVHCPNVFERSDNVGDDNYFPSPQYPEKEEDTTSDKEVTFLDVWHLVEKLPETNLTKAVGVANFSKNKLKKILDDPKTKVVPAVNMVESHPLLPQDELASYCKEKNIVMQTFLFSSTKNPFKREPVIAEIVEKNEVTPNQVLVNYNVKRGLPVLPKAKKQHRIIENIKVFDLSDEDFEKLNNMHKTNGTKRLVNTDWIDWD
ncbi:HHR256Cp [Eremothecium sinecaudum]|uniref:HHR256Cp n=1 Tax=Eremothecium sinecaudum TaxID=45286 RepID=A0A120K2Y8_9SACH|nr:HHR256Cp [Eremothecium sinecaudum]AMD23025.1 HHR256Cp [Eremothecium sinecaudum]